MLGISELLDGIFEAIASLLNFFYGVVPNYAVAIALLTCALMVITTPLTMKSTRSMIEMQRLQPQIRRLQQQYKDDRQKLNEEMMRFYKEHQINPLGGCLPILIQAPVFSILFWVVRGLTNQANFIGLQREVGGEVTDGFKPKYLDQSAELYQSLLGRDEMLAFGVDLAISPSEALSEGFVTAIPYVAIVLIIAGLSWVQQKQIMGRNPSADVNPQQKMMMRIGPVIFVGAAFALPAALGVYFVVSTIWRVAQQGYITRSLYRGEDSVGAQAQKAMAEARAEKEGDGKASENGSSKRGAGSKAAATSKAAKSSGNGAAGARTGQSKATGSATSGAGAKAKPHPRSRKKKKRK